jgi:4-hydroxybenzoate polyprenyltransferase
MPRRTMVESASPELPASPRPAPIAAAWEIVRPFTLVAPALGMLSGAVTAYGAHPRGAHLQGSFRAWVVDVAVGALAAAVLNGASNVLNQVYDLPIDRINKPSRVLPSGRLSVRAALLLSAALYAASLAAAASINAAVFTMFAAAAAATVVYSAPPLRTKRFGWWANVTIAIPRGTLLKVAGWSVTKPVLAPEAWLIGAVFGLFLLGATTSKDFADVEGDGAHGCRTLPVLYGRARATRMIHPFFTVPFLLLAAGAGAGVFTGNRIVLVALGLGCAAWGHAVVRMLQRDPDAQVTENHPSWRHMYYLMFTLQVGFMVAYLV